MAARRVIRLSATLQSNVERLRQQLDELRRAQRRLGEWSGGFNASDD